MEAQDFIFALSLKEEYCCHLNNSVKKKKKKKTLDLSAYYGK